ncbi:phosphopantetheine-binding protein [Enterococcus faecalis]|uniref:phosphopantetheine-binding protein n=1 Tax=Enterococcus faecalis TaxID=1351 RepID=UPI00044FF452|nr:phosphopantetheine-binding protein [Enterococcus faecalis]ETU65112.1 hypothetical protein P026_00248 [Enterococcus faecalis EnGen0426]
MESNTIKGKAKIIIERWLSDIIDGSKIDASDNLIEKGLSSIQIMQLSGKLKKNGIIVPFAKLIENPSKEKWFSLVDTAKIKEVNQAKKDSRKISEAFPLTDVQYSYFIGREDDQTLGGIGCHAYLEIDEEGLFINWDVRKSMFPIDMLNEMFSEFKEALNNLAILEANWNRIDFVPIKFEKIDRYKRSTTPNLKPTINGNDKSENDDKIEFYHKENEDIDDLDKTEILVHDICLIELKVKNIRKNRSLYEYNADSLTMAKIASKIRNKTNIPFEEILKTLLFEPTIENIAHFIKKYKENMDERESFQEQAEGSKFIYTKTYEDINNPYENKARIFIYGPFGNGEMYEDLANLLASQCQGKVLTMGIYNIDKFLEMDSERVVPYFSEECFKELNKTNIDSVQIIGYCFGGVVAMELTRLFLKKGINVMDFTIIEGGSAKEIKYDDLLLEIMFLQAFDVTLFDLGIKQTDLMEGIYNNADVTEVTLSDLISKLSNKNDINTLKSLQKEEQEERFDLYSNLINSKEHKKELSKSSLLESFKIYKTSLKAQNYQPDIFLRDFNYVIAKDNTGTYKNFDKILDNWTEILMGEINKKYTSGNHYSCVENNDHIPKLASLLAIPELAIRG